MAVLVEAFSVLIRVKAIESLLLGGVPRFFELVPNETLCSDGVLCRVGFMAMEDALFFANQLLGEGLTAATDGCVESPDVAIASQSGEMVYPCAWIELDQLEIGGVGRTVWGASMEGKGELPLATPKGWTYDRYASFSKVDVDTIADVTGSNDVVREFVDSDGTTRYLGRPFHKPDGPPH